MNNSDTLSVDPGRITLGELHPELKAPVKDNQNTYISQYADKKSGEGNQTAADLFFATASMKSNRKGLALLLVRWGIAAILITSGCLIISGQSMPPGSLFMPHAFAIMEIVTGTMLALGMLTRMAMLVPTLGFGAFAVASAMNASFNMEALSCLMACIIFLIFGPGKYSCDFLIRKAIISHSEGKRNKLVKKRMSYQAFRYAHHS